MEKNFSIGDKNLSDYEREKLEEVSSQLARISEMIEMSIEMVDYCDRNGIVLFSKPYFGDLKATGGVAGPESKLCKLESNLELIQKLILDNLSEGKVEEMEKELGFNVEINEEIKEEIDPGQYKGYNG